MKTGKRSILAGAVALALSLACAVTVFAAGAPEGDVPELPPPIAKNVVGVDLEMSVLGRGADCFVDNGEVVLYEAHVRNDTEDPWEGDVRFSIPVPGAESVCASGNPEKLSGTVTWQDVRLEPFTNVTYYITVSNDGNRLPESFVATLVAAGHEGFPSGSSSRDGCCGVPGLCGRLVKKADRDILEIRNGSLKGGAGRVRIQVRGDMVKELTKNRGMKGVTYDASAGCTEIMLGGTAQPGLKLDVTGLDVTGILFDACGDQDFAMVPGDNGIWSMPLVKGHGFTDFEAE